MRDMGTKWQIWRSYRETVHFFGPKWVIFGVLALQNQERLFMGSDVESYFPFACLDVWKKRFSIGIHSIYRAS